MKVRDYIASALLVVIVCLLAAPNFAREATAPVQSIGDADTRLEVDTERDLIRIFVDGKQYAVIDAEGMHINGAMTMTGNPTVQAPASKYPAYPEEE